MPMGEVYEQSWLVFAVKGLEETKRTSAVRVASWSRATKLVNLRYANLSVVELHCVVLYCAVVYVPFSIFHLPRAICHLPPFTFTSQSSYALVCIPRCVL